MATPTTNRDAALATISNAAYLDSSPTTIGNWTRISVTDTTKVTSGFFGVAYYNAETKQVVVSFRGTDSGKDLLTDTTFATGGWNQQFTDAAAYTKQIKDVIADNPTKYQDPATGKPFDILTTGHSLGGGIAQVIAKMFGLGGSTYEAPGANKVVENAQFAAVKTQYASDSSGNIGADFTNYRAEGSLISSVGTTLGNSQNLINLTDAGAMGFAGAALTIAGVATGGLGGLVTAALGAAGVNIDSTHPMDGIERAMYLKAGLENALASGELKMQNVLWSQATGQTWTGLGSEPQVTVFKGADDALKGYIQKEGTGWKLSSADGQTTITLTPAVDKGQAPSCIVKEPGKDSYSCAVSEKGGATTHNVDNNRDGVIDQSTTTFDDGSYDTTAHTTNPSGEAWTLQKFDAAGNVTEVQTAVYDSKKGLTDINSYKDGDLVAHVAVQGKVTQAQLDQALALAEQMGEATSFVDTGKSEGGQTLLETLGVPDGGGLGETDVSTGAGSALQVSDSQYSGSNENAAPMFTALNEYASWLTGRGTVVDVNTNNLVADPSLLALQDGPLSIVMARQNPSAVNVLRALQNVVLAGGVLSDEFKQSVADQLGTNTRDVNAWVSNGGVAITSFLSACEDPTPIKVAQAGLSMLRAGSTVSKSFVKDFSTAMGVDENIVSGMLDYGGAGLSVVATLQNPTPENIVASTQQTTAIMAKINNDPALRDLSYTLSDAVMVYSVYNFAKNPSPESAMSVMLSIGMKVAPEYAIPLAAVLTVSEAVAPGFTNNVVSGLVNGVGVFVDAATGLVHVVEDVLGGLGDGLEDIWDSITPITLNLTGGEVHTTTLSGGSVMFDMAGNGVPVKTGWVTPDHGFLVRDLNGNGQIDSSNEMFTERTSATASSAFGALAELDDNKDGKVNSSDAAWSTLKIWVDKNSDGRTQSNELYTLAQLGIASLSVAALKNFVYDNGNIIGDKGVFTYTDGRTGNMADAIFTTSSTSDTAVAQALMGYDATTVRLPNGQTMQVIQTHNKNYTINPLQGLNVVSSQGGNTITATDDMNGIVLMGTSGDVLKSGNASNVTLVSLGDAKLYGGSKDNVYIVSQTSDVVVEGSSSGGTDTVKASASYVLPDYVENLILTGTESINGTGNALNNLIVGNSASNVLTGGAGADTLTGGAGNDTYVFARKFGQDAVIENDATPGNIDTLWFDANIHGSNVALARLNDDLWVSVSGGGGEQIRIANWFTDSANQVEQMKFADGTVWSLSDIQSRATSTDVAGATGASATLLIGGSYIESVSSSGDHDYYKVVLRGGVTYQFDLAKLGSSDLDSYLRLRDASGNEVANNNDGGGDKNALLTYTPTSAGTYYLDAGAFNDTSTGGYTVSVVQRQSGTSGADSLNGFNGVGGNTGIDQLEGGRGNDTYQVDNLDDVVIERIGEGEDTVQSLVDYTLGANVENLTLLSSDAIRATGNELNNLLTGNARNNVLDGGLGNDTLNGLDGIDTLKGGAGDDTYIVDSTTDTIVENANEGTDTLKISLSYSLASVENIENLTLTGNSAINGTGTGGNNVLIGNSGNNILDAGAGNDTLEGGAGTDTLKGGAGDDIYIVDSATDTITENTGEGTDTVQSSVTYTLASNVENLTLTGFNAINGTGNSLSNVITGNSDNNILDGGLGTDTLAGGAGDDTYIVDSTTDTIAESGDNGIDTVQSNVTFSLDSIGNVENLMLTGSSAINGTGNYLNNLLTGNGANNTLDAGAGNDTLNGGAGVDTLKGGSGDDTYVIDSSTDTITEKLNEGTDTVQSSVSYTLGSNVEILALTGSGAINATGNELNNQLTGNGANNTLDAGAGNDTLNGGAGVDTLIGGVGDDVYMVDSTSDVITERLGEGVDSVSSSASYTLSANVENLLLTWVLAINGDGNDQNNKLTGNSANNVLTGAAGDDTLDGGDGADTLYGGTGDDVYIVNDVGDMATEYGGAGTDTVQSRVTYTLGSNIENLTLTGVSLVDGVGNNLNNRIVGNSNSNVLDGGTGVDTLIGGEGDDTYVVDDTNDVVTESAGQGTDWVNAHATYTLYADVENLTLTGSDNINATGNDSSNLLAGNNGNNILDGKGGNDTLRGGFGSDTYVFGRGYGKDVVSDLRWDTTEIDTVQMLEGVSPSDVLVTRNSWGDMVLSISGTTDQLRLSNWFSSESARIEQVQFKDGTLWNVSDLVAKSDIATAGDDRLTAFAAGTALQGGLGDDTYFIESVGVSVVENANEGWDQVNSNVSYTLEANAENLSLYGNNPINGTGNALDNWMVGNYLSNVLDGGDGTDTLKGGLGDDIYVVDSTTDQITEYVNQGEDTIKSSVTFSLDSIENVENLTLTGSGAINGTGNSSSNVLTGNSGNNTLDAGDGSDTLDGGAGTDTLKGGSGDDIYIVDSCTDTITENSGEGTDTVQSSTTNTLVGVANVENLKLMGISAINGTGNDLNNEITGNSANNTLDGGVGADTLIGGIGDDIYVVDSATDTITEYWSEGTDTIQSTVTFSLASIENVENLTLTSNGAISGTGNSLNNVLTGNSASNTLDGGSGTDTLKGGAGDDVYIVDSTTDTITENSGEGADTVQSRVTYALGSNLENLTLTGSASVNGTGNSLNNVLTGNSANNTLDGGSGTDTLKGGLGDDTYIVDSTTDTITENSGEGTDTVQSSVTYTLGSNLENLTLTGSSAINGTGNSLNNVLLGNSANNTLDAGAGNDTLNGGAGTDTLKGGAGDDIYIVDSTTDTITENSGEGTDTVQSTVTYTLGSIANVENLTLTGSAAINGTGNGLNNVLTGNSANNTLDGGSGTDTLRGGAGDDTYIVDSTTDTITENASEGTDTVQSSVTYTLGGNLENLTLTGSSAINGTGNSLNNVLLGNSANNTLDAGAGNDTLDGGAGTDTLKGGIGDDVYIVDSTTDTITENASEGVDTVQSSVTYTLGSNLENLTLTGSTAVNGTGNSLNNVLTGNSANNTLDAGAGNDTLDGGAGTDTLKGGAGDDVYIVDSTTDTITENASEGVDTVQSSVTYTLGSNLENLTLTGSTGVNGTGNSANNVLTGNSANNTLDGGSGTDTLKGGAGDDIYIVDSTTDTITENTNEGFDTVQSSVTFSLASIVNVENLTLTGSSAIDGTGNSWNNVLVGNSANNTLDGGAGTDTLKGGAGDDTYVIDSATETITENASEGIDTVQSSVTYTLGGNLENLTLTGFNAINGTGNSLNNVLLGNGANNTLDGGAGTDTLKGGAGDDVYVVDSTTDTITENASEGTDTVQSSVMYTLGSNLENLTLTGSSAINATGNSLNNMLTGNSGNNTLDAGAGNDTLDGGAGTDTLKGGTGDDVYIVDSSTDSIIENASEGADTVQSSVTYTLGNNLENLVLVGVGAINGTGNSLSNTLTGNNGNNTLDGGAGSDTLKGGAGDDIYIVDSTGDLIIENASEGTDTVQSGVTYTLDSNIENLTLTGSAAVNGTGNSLNNVLTGNSANNTLDAGAGNDTLDGGAGTDTLKGGAGDDVYIVDSTTDTITENASEGTDTVQSGVTYALGSNLENLTLTGSSSVNGTGNSLNNVLLGTVANNTLDGGSGTDTLKGGAGDDIYIVDSTTDTITENVSEGADTVQSSVTYTLGSNLENLTLTGSTAINGTGNSLNNVLTGNSANNMLDGGAGNDTLDGGAGTDTLKGGTGDDVYIVDSTTDTITENSGEGTDTVQSSVTFSLNSIVNVENLTLTGSAAINGTGNGLNNVLTGNSANNTLDGGSGTDTLSGGLGDDIYIVDSTTDTITENFSEGADTVQSSVTYTLGSNLENLTLTGSTAINGTGNSLNNVLTGNSANNTLDAGAGNDTLDGGAGTDTLKGGAGDDSYIVDSTTDTITENASEGTDTVKSSVTYTLGSNLENLTLTGSGAINGTGNSLNNVLTGNSANNTLDAGAGNDTLDGGAGTDTLKGGAGDDIYIVDSTTDTITENASEGADTVQSSVTYTLGSNLENLGLTGATAVNGTGNSLNNVLAGNSANNTLDGGSGTDTLKGGLGDDTYIVDSTTDTTTENSGEGTDTVQSSVTYTLGSNLENLTLTGSTAINATGNSLNNVITGNSANNTLDAGAGNDTLDGGAGTDTLKGGAGDDVYIVDSTTDTITENSGEGTDTIQTSVTYTLGSNLENLTLTGSTAINGIGNSLNNVLTGNGGNNTLDAGSGNDTLDGGAGTDTLKGGAGDDIYIVDSATDTITENSGEGTDTVQSSVAFSLTSTANVENLTLSGSSAINGTGNSLNNLLTGNDANNTLDGGTGSDTLKGGLGDDIYILDNTSDTIIENLNEGSDTVKSSVSYSLGSNLENLTLTGTDSVNGTGNGMNNILTGNSANNTLDGGAGIDTLKGGMGNDIYILDSTTDSIIENINEGEDTVQSSVSYALDAYLENLQLTGTTAINGTGNSLNNTVIGNSANNLLDGGSGNDTLNGGAGIDTLKGGAGDDTYVIDSNTNSIIENLNEGSDTVQSSVSYSLDSNLENLTLTGPNSINATGNGLNNILIGNSANNVLDGGSGVDTLKGGMGDDIYIVDSTTDAITENSGEGTDTVQSSVTYVLSNNLENLTLAGEVVINGTGNELDNLLIGNSASNILFGGAGDDTLDGGGESDTASYKGASSGYKIERIMGAWHVIDINPDDGDEGNDKLINIEKFVFSDAVFDLRSEFLINDFEINYGLSMNLASFNDGGFVITWSGQNKIGGDSDVYARRYDLFGNPLGEAFQVNTFTQNAQNDSRVAALGDGGFLVTWTSYNQDVSAGSKYGQRYDSKGVPVGNEFKVDKDTSYQYSSAITDLNGNGYVIVWIASPWDIYAKIYNSDGVAEGASFMVNGLSLGQKNIDDHSVLSLKDGSFLVSWDNLKNGSHEGLFIQKYTDVGDKVGDSIKLDLTNYSVDGQLMELANGDYLVVWTSWVAGWLSDICAQRFDSTGHAIGDFFKVSGSISVHEEFSKSVALSDGGYVVTWVSETTDGNILGLYGQRYDSNNMKLGLSFRVDSNDFQSKSAHDIDIIGDNGFVVSWVSYNQGGNDGGFILSKFYDAQGNAISVSLSGTSSADTMNIGLGVTAQGGLGDDTYIISDSLAQILEREDAGVDIVQSSASYTLALNLENLTLTGNADINAKGNSSSNLLTGNAGNNILDGQGGNDILIGGAGADKFNFTISDNVAVIKDFNASEGDSIGLSSAVFSQLLGKSDLTMNFRFSTQTPQGDDDYIVYDNGTGKLYYDSTGRSATFSSAIHFATLENKPTVLSGSLFTVM